MIDDTVCLKCKMPMLVVRTDGFPWCSSCEQEIRKEAKQRIATKKTRDGFKKLSMKEWRYVPG